MYTRFQGKKKGMKYCRHTPVICYIKVWTLCNYIWWVVSGIATYQQQKIVFIQEGIMAGMWPRFNLMNRCNSRPRKMNFWPTKLTKQRFIYIVPDMIEKTPAPVQVLEMIWCNCKTGCVTFQFQINILALNGHCMTFVVIAMEHVPIPDCWMKVTQMMISLMTHCGSIPGIVQCNELKEQHLIRLSQSFHCHNSDFVFFLQCQLFQWLI